MVDDDPSLRRSMARMLGALGFEVESVCDGKAATRKLQSSDYNLIVSDIAMPGMNGIQLLRAVRDHDLDVPVILVTGEPTVDTAVQALEYGALHYLAKPVDFKELDRVIEKGVQLHRMAKVKREAMKLLGGLEPVAGDRAGLEASFDSAVDKLWMAYQPIVRRDRTLFGYEALLRSDEPRLPHPGAILEAAERLGRLPELGRKIRDRAAISAAPAGPHAALFVNLHPRDLLDETITSRAAPLSQIAKQVVLEITERSALAEIKDVRARVAELREMGFRIAVDDLGAGYAGLTSFALLEPEIVKLDMTLTRDVHKVPTKQKLIASMTQVCKDMGMMVVGEGVETIEERDTLIDLGVDLLQGYLIAKPGRPFPNIGWPEGAAPPSVK